MNDSVVRGTVVTSMGTLRDGWVAIAGERITAVGTGQAPPAATVLDYGENLVLPGLVDGHMHTSSAIGWPGIEGATRSAAAGGVTTCVDMPYDVPQAVTDARALADKIGWVNRTAHVDVALYGTIAKQGGIGAIEGLAAGGACSFKLSTYEYDPVRFPRIDHPTMVEAFGAIARTGVPVSVHNEDQELVERLTAEARAAGQTDAIMHCRTRPPLAETLADNAIFEIGLLTGAHVHIAHSSVARGFEIAAAFRAMGGQATGETCIQYLCMTEDDLVRLGGRGKCNPPFRTASEVERIWAALAADQVAYVSTDHAPWPADRKGFADIFACGAGLVGLQSFAPLMYTLLDERGLPPSVMAAHCAERPARHHGLDGRKGAIAPGKDADLLVLEPGRFTFDEAQIQDRPELRWSPYHGRPLRARVAATLLRGRIVWDGQAVLAKPGDGRFIRRGAA
ncbi:MAG TPA: amidohydrolase family protein [Acetobacteraceae bacterium]